MISSKVGTGRIVWVVTAALLLSASAISQTVTPLQLLQQLNEFPHARNIDQAELVVRDYEIGLGAMQKLGGVWRFKHSERFSGALTTYTWQLKDGFTSIEVMDGLVAQVEELEQVELLFACKARACGQGVQWANRVFHQPVLYGREDLQRYRVYSVGEQPRKLLVIYSAARTADRQYLHAELLAVQP